MPILQKSSRTQRENDHKARNMLPMQKGKEQVTREGEKGQVETPNRGMTFVHLVYIPFTGVGIPGYRGDAWFKKRVEIFKSYTLTSLLTQTEQNFVIWLSFRPEEAASPTTAGLLNYLKDIGVQYIVTFDGLMYHDDKYGGGLKKRVWNWGRLVRAAWRNGEWRALPKAIALSYKDKNASLALRLKSSLAVLEKYFGTADRIYMTRIDSDDLFHYDAIKMIQQAAATRDGAIICGKGYIYNATTTQMAEYSPRTNPPFYTIIFPRQIFFNAHLHKAYYGDFKSHEDIPKQFKCARLPDGLYCVVTHNPKNQISTVWNHPFRGSLVDNTKMAYFGC